MQTNPIRSYRRRAIAAGAITTLVAALALPGAALGQDVPELTDEFSVQHAEWAGQTVDTSEYATEAPYNIATIVQGPTNGWGTIFDTVLNSTLNDSGLVENQLYVPWDFTTESQSNGIEAPSPRTWTSSS